MILLKILAICCLLYFILMLILTGGGSFFHYIWFAAALILWGITAGFEHGLIQRIPGPVLFFLAAAFAAVCLAMGFALAGILRGVRSVPSDEAAYLIVLGARLRGAVPSRALVFRMKKALSYMSSHPDCKVIVSGGQGPLEKNPGSRSNEDIHGGTGNRPFGHLYRRSILQHTGESEILRQDHRRPGGGGGKTGNRQDPGGNLFQ